MPVPGAESIPLGSLRAKLSELDPEASYAVTCQVGLRGHIACRILEQHGFDAVNVSGGAASLRVVQS